MIMNMIPVKEPINSKANGKISVNIPLTIRNKPTAFANLFLSPLKVSSL